MRIKVWLRIASFVTLLILFAAALNSEFLSLLLQGDVEAIRELSNENLWMMLGISFLLMIVQNTLTIIPLILLISVNVTMFGFLYGYIWSWGTSIIGAIVAFYAARFWFSELLTRRLSQRIRRKIENNGFAFVFLARIIPFMPTSLINIAAGVSSIKLNHFVFSTLIGNMIYMFVLALIPLGIMSIEIENVVYVGLAALFIVGFAVYKVMQRKRRGSPGDAAPDPAELSKLMKKSCMKGR